MSEHTHRGGRSGATCGRSHMPAEGCRAGSARQSFVFSLLRCECRLKRLESLALRLYGSDHRQFTSVAKNLTLSHFFLTCVIKSGVYHCSKIEINSKYSVEAGGGTTSTDSQNTLHYVISTVPHTHNTHTHQLLVRKTSLRSVPTQSGSRAPTTMTL